MIRASDFLSRCYQTLRIPCDAPRSDAKVLKTIKTPPRRPAQKPIQYVKGKAIQ